MSRIKLSILALAGALFAGDVRADIIVNGGFEQPAVAGLDLQVLAGSAAIPGWTVVAGSVDVVNQGLFASFAGKQSLDLDGVSAGTIEQSFSTTPGTSYRLTFEYANNPVGPTVVPMAAVSLTGSSSIFTEDISHSGSSTSLPRYSEFSTNFTADSATTTLRFTSLDAPSSVNGIVLDAVSVVPNAVPEPSSLVLMGVAVVAAAFGRYVTRRRAA